MRRPVEEFERLKTDHLLRKLEFGDWNRDNESQYDKTEKNASLCEFASNDYLGIAQSAWLRNTLKSNLDDFGSGAGASRLITGSSSAHQQLEETLAVTKDKEVALTFSSGYATALGTLGAILQKGDVVILDKLCHASLIDGAKLSGARIRTFKHNDIDHLKSKLISSQKQIDKEGRILIVTEAVFSMDGDRAPLKEITELKTKYNALLLVDEAHSFGVIGPQGKGLVAEEKLHNQVDFQMGTLSKAVGLSGGFIACSNQYAQLIINRARSFIYSTAPPPFLVASANDTIQYITGEEGDKLRTQLWQNRSLINTDTPTDSAIAPVIVGSTENALQISKSLEEEGYLVPAIRFPTVPRDQARLRIVVSAVHERVQIEILVSHLDRLLKFS